MSSYTESIYYNPNNPEADQIRRNLGGYEPMGDADHKPNSGKETPHRPEIIKALVHVDGIDVDSLPAAHQAWAQGDTSFVKDGYVSTWSGSWPVRLTNRSS